MDNFDNKPGSAKNISLTQQKSSIFLKLTAALIAVIFLVAGIITIYYFSKKADAAAKKSLPAVAGKAFTVQNFNGVVNCNGVELKMVKISAGSFTMGSSDAEAHSDETPHHVTLTRDYWLGKYEVTQAQWQAVMGKNPSRFKGKKLPVECVSWEDAKKFCDKLNEAYEGKLPKNYQFDLPTEAQWEYACRGGNISKDFKYSGSNDLNEVGWYNSKSGTSPVGTKKANELGLYDMSGNVAEWCRDWYASYTGDIKNPEGPEIGKLRVYRDGSWNNIANFCRPTGRYSWASDSHSSGIGFRLALVYVR